MDKIYIKVGRKEYMFFDLKRDKYKLLYTKDLLDLIKQIKLRNNILITQYLNERFEQLIVNNSVYNVSKYRSVVYREIFFYSELLNYYFKGLIIQKRLRRVTVLHDIHIPDIYLYTDLYRQGSPQLVDRFPVLLKTEHHLLSFYIREKKLEIFYFSLDWKLQKLEDKISQWLQ